MEKTNINKRNIAAAVIVIILLAIILITAIPYLANTVVGNHIAENPKTVTFEVVSEFDAAFSDNKFTVFNAQGLKRYSEKGNFDSDYYKNAYSPSIGCKDPYTVLYDTDSKEADIIKNNTLKYTVKAPQNIKCASVSKNGYCTVVTSEKGYKSAVLVFDQNGTNIYSWFADEGYVSDAVLSDNSKELAVSRICIENGKIQSKLTRFKLNSEDAVSTVISEGAVAYKLIYIGSDIILITDKKILLCSKNGKIKNEYSYKGKELECFDTLGNGVVLSLSEDMSCSTVVYLNRRLKETGTYKADFLISMIDANNSKCIISGVGRVAVLDRKCRPLVKGELKKDGKYILLGKNWRNFAVINSTQMNIFEIKRGR